ncbi:MAG: FAD-dependent oxidoreductase [Spirochaetales bacterium]|nr:FAD-dependent oxidoreductase [Spirochaetales bacterium]
MHTDIKGYVNLIAEGKFVEAIELIREKLFLPATLGRVCAHPCEGSCKRNELESAMSIAALKRFVADNYDDPDLWDTTTASAREERVAVIGAGPAGAQAAFDLAKEGFRVTIFDRLPVVGGMLHVGIPAYRLPRNVITAEYEILKMMGVEFRLGVDIGNDISFDEIEKEYDGVVIAVGAHRGVVIPVPGHDLPGVFNAVDFLRDVSLNGAFQGLGSSVAVIGGGNVAVDVVRSARRIGIEHVHLIMLEGDIDESPAHNWELEEALEEGVRIHYGRGTVRIAGDGHVEAIELKRCTAVFNDEGRFDPQYDESDVIALDVESVIFAVGQATDGSFASTLETTRGGRFVVDETTLQTSIPNVVVAGDASGHSVIAVEAMAEGRKAATTLVRFFDGRDIAVDRELERAYESKLETEIPEDAVRRDRVVSAKRPAAERVMDFREYDFGLTEQQARDEAGGCLKCECLKCVKECEMLSDFSECPKQLFREMLEAPEIAPIIPYSCNMCKQCTIVCPKEFDMQGIFGGMRQQMVADNNGKSPMKGHNVIYMHQKLGFSKAFNTTVAAPEGTTKRVFIPGCSLPSHNPEAVGKIFTHLQERLGNTGAILKCCGKPTKALGQADQFKERYGQLQAEIDKLGAEEIIVACQSCFLNMSAYSPNQRVRSLWEIMPEIGLPEGAAQRGKGSDLTFAIHDSCSTRDRSGIHDGIRWIMNELGYETEEPPHTRETARCCGFGGMVVPANPELAGRVMSRRTSEVESDHMVTYCAACRESMVKGGKEAAHILDLVFDPTKTTETEFVGVGGGPLKAWANRYKAKKALENAGKQHRRSYARRSRGVTAS